MKTVMYKRSQILNIAKKNIKFLEKESLNKRVLIYNEFKKEFDLMLYSNNYTF